MKAAALLVAVVFAVLLGLPSSFAAPCECSSKKELPTRKCGENDVTYYRRVFTIEDSSDCSVKKFYTKVFTQYAGEDNKNYVRRIDVIFGNVYTNLDCRTKLDRQDYLEKYYKYKYCKNSNEDDEAFFERVLPRTSESEDSYECKVQLLKRFVKKVDWSKVKLEKKSKRGFSLISKSSRARSCDEGKKKKKEEKKREKDEKKDKKSCGCNKNKSEKKSCGCQDKKNAEHAENERKVKQREEEHKKNEKIVKEREEEHKKNQKKIKEREEEHERNVKKAEEQKRQHAENEKQIKQREEEHERNVKKAEEQKRQHAENEKKIKQREEEHERNVKKAEEQKRQHAENEKKIKQREEEHEKNKKKIEEREKTHEENVKKIEARKKEKEENAKKWIRANYCRKNNEDDVSYFKRICTKTVSTDEEYIERITQVRREYSDLDLWYNEKYLSETKQYYSLVYTKKSTETEEQYFKRLVTKESYESDYNCARKIYLLHIIFPSLSLWYDEKYYESYAKFFYQTYYRKEQSESDEVYLQRVFTRTTTESEENFWKRIRCVQRTFPDYSCWHNKDLLQKIEVCKGVSQVTSEAELKQKVEAEKKSEETEEARKAKLSCLQVFFRSSKKSKKVQTTEESQEEETSYASKCQ